LDFIELSAITEEFDYFCIEKPKEAVNPLPLLINLKSAPFGQLGPYYVNSNTYKIEDTQNFVLCIGWFNEYIWYLTTNSRITMTTSLTKTGMQFILFLDPNPPHYGPFLSARHLPCPFSDSRRLIAVLSASHVVFFEILFCTLPNDTPSCTSKMLHAMSLLHFSTLLPKIMLDALNILEPVVFTNFSTGLDKNIPVNRTFSFFLILNRTGLSVHGKVNFPIDYTDFNWTTIDSTATIFQKQYNDFELNLISYYDPGYWSWNYHIQKNITKFGRSTKIRIRKSDADDAQTLIIDTFGPNNGTVGFGNIAWTLMTRGGVLIVLDSGKHTIHFFDISPTKATWISSTELGTGVHDVAYYMNHSPNNNIVIAYRSFVNSYNNYVPASIQVFGQTV
jgi:hypothetical protein